MADKATSTEQSAGASEGSRGAAIAEATIAGAVVGGLASFANPDFLFPAWGALLGAGVGVVCGAVMAPRKPADEDVALEPIPAAQAKPAQSKADTKSTPAKEKAGVGADEPTLTKATGAKKSPAKKSAAKKSAAVTTAKGADSAPTKSTPPKTDLAKGGPAAVDEAATATAAGAAAAVGKKGADSKAGDKTVPRDKVADSKAGDKTVPRDKVADSKAGDKTVPRDKVADSKAGDKTVPRDKVADSKAGAVDDSDDLILVIEDPTKSTEPSKPAEPAKAEPAKTEPVKAAEPAKAEPAKAEPVKAEPAKTEPAKAAEPAKASTPAKSKVIPKEAIVSARPIGGKSAEWRRDPQCPACGSFEPEQTGKGFACRRCRNSWTWAPGEAWPAVLLRPDLKMDRPKVAAKAPGSWAGPEKVESATYWNSGGGRPVTDLTIAAFTDEGVGGGAIRRMVLAEGDDGSSHAAAGTWASLLVDGFRASGAPSSTDPAAFGKMIGAQRSTWGEARSAPASASFVGLELLRTKSGVAWRAVLAGNVVLHVVRGGAAVSSLDGTGTSPLGTARPKGRDELRRSAGHLEVGDVILLASSGLAASPAGKGGSVGALASADRGSFMETAKAIGGDDDLALVHVGVVSKASEIVS